MPNRIIKESINESKSLSRISPFAQDLFKRLITYSDDYGRFDADIEMMRVRLYPRELSAVSLEDIDGALVELVGIKKIKLYTCKTADPDHIFGIMVGWEKHQRVRESKNKFPEPEDYRINDWYLGRFVPYKLKIEIFQEDKFKCQRCGVSFRLNGVPARRAIRLLEGVLRVGHVVPVYQGGRATKENLQLICVSCSLSSKGPVLPEDILEDFGNNSRQGAASCGELRQSAATCGLNPIQSNPNPKDVVRQGSLTTPQEGSSWQKTFFEGNQRQGAADCEELRQSAATRGLDSIPQEGSCWQKTFFGGNQRQGAADCEELRRDAATPEDILKDFSNNSRRAAASCGELRRDAATPKDEIPYQEIIEDLNRKSGKDFDPKAKYARKLIRARWKEGYRLEDFKLVHDNKIPQWINDPKMYDYIRPKTLYAGENFESYLKEKPHQHKGKLGAFGRCPGCKRDNIDLLESTGKCKDCTKKVV